jgi:hypothetical protein
MVSSARRTAVPRRLLLPLAAVVAVCLAAPLAAAAATTRYASPTGTGASPCLATAPCSLETAVSFAEGLHVGDTVLLAPGTYHPAASVKVFVSVTISGEAGKPAPLIEATGEYGLFMQDASTVRDIRIKSPSGTTSGLFMLTAGSTVERVESFGEASRACTLIGAVARDTVCSATPILGGGEGVEMSVSGSTPTLTETRLVNVTAIGGYAGISVGSNQKSSLALDATNTIVAGGQTDVAASSAALTAPITVTLSHSNFETVETSGAEVHVSQPTEAGNQTAAPLFVDEAAGDYRERAASPTRLAGDLGVVLPGEVDLAGNPRTTNCAGTIGVDIGAYQFECPVPVVTPPAEEKKIETTPISAPAPTKPSLSKLALKPPKFVVAGKPPKGAAGGTTISFALSAAATVKLEVLQKKTVKGKKPKTVTVGSLPKVKGKAGPNSVKFSGKLKGAALEPGKYTLRVTAIAGRLSSAPRTKPFEVLAPAS